MPGRRTGRKGARSGPSFQLRDQYRRARYASLSDRSAAPTRICVMSRQSSEVSRHPDKVRPTRHVKAGRLIPRVFIEQVLHAGIE